MAIPTNMSKNHCKALAWAPLGQARTLPGPAGA